MSIQDWGAIGEIGGAIAIFVTLVYLATQIRYARLTAMDVNRNNRVVGIRELNGELVTDSFLRSAWNKAAGPQYQQLVKDIAEELGLSVDEASIVFTQGANWVYTHWVQYRSMKTDEDEEELRNIILVWYGENPMRMLMTHPSFRVFFEEAFVVWIDKIIGTSPLKPS
jgi:hypothetical protein